jgi:solute carrier family 13 (sodium-dependent dicarboxylate transporter), member 2/3/5
MPNDGHVEIDTRPLWIILLARSRPLLMLLIGIAIYWGVDHLPAPAGLAPSAQGALAVFGLCIFYWVFDVLPLMITSLLAIVLLPLTGVMSSRDAYAQFGNEAVFFILGAFILAAAMMKSGLSSRIALIILRRFGRKPATLLRGIFLLNGTMSFVMSEHAVAAMTFPIILELVAALQLPRGRSNYAKALFLAMAWGTSIGGVATLLGGARAPLAIGILREVTGESFSFAQWAVINVPLALLLMSIAWILLRVLYPIDLTDISAAEEAVEERLMRTGRVTLQEAVIAGVMGLTILAWIVLGEQFGLANIALAAVVALFALGVVQWRDVEGYVNWGLILMYGGAICLGSALNRSGAASWVAHQTIAKWADGPVSVVMMVSLATVALTEVMSNSAAVAIIMPVSIAVAQQFGIDPRVMAPIVAVPAGMAFMLPIGTPANAIAFSSGHLRLSEMMWPGMALNLSAYLLFNLLVFFYWPLLGIKV